MTPAERELLLLLAQHAGGRPGDPVVLSDHGEVAWQGVHQYRERLWLLMDRVRDTDPDFAEVEPWPTVTKDLPRRVHRELWSQAEHAIQQAIDRVEEMPADPRLTDAVILLGQAKSRVADYVEQ